MQQEASPHNNTIPERTSARKRTIAVRALDHIFTHARKYYERLLPLRRWVLDRTGSDTQLLIIIVILSALLRAPMIGLPERALFDEVIYANFASFVVEERPLFDIHPPLARMIFAEILDNTATEVRTFPIETNVSFVDFPYTTLRLFIAMLGILLPPILFVIARMLGLSPRSAALAALFAVFDNALVLYSRTLLPDTILLVFNFLGIAATLALVKSSSRPMRILFSLIAGIMIGSALSIKWTALGVLATSYLICMFFGKHWKALLMITAVTTLTYISVFIIYFSHFTEGGKADPIFAAFQRPWVTELEYPKGNELGEVLAFIPEFHEKMLNANRDPEVAKATLQSPDPITWPVARANILFWVGDDGKRVDLMPNELLWFFSFFVLLAEVGWVIWHMATTRTFGISRVEILLLLAYAGNYLPFFFIDRPMFLYHYFTSLLFLFLLIPFVLPRIIKCIATVTKDRNFAYAIMSATILLALVNFFLLAPTTYGF